MSDTEQPIEEIIMPSDPRHRPPTLTLGIPSSKSTAVKAMGAEDEFIDDDDLDETLSERLWALTEMFPDGLRSVSSGLCNFSIQGTKVLYSLSRSGLWVAASSATILALPIMFEQERSQMEEQQIQQQRQILLGPNAAAASSSGGLMGNLPSVSPPAQPR